MFLHREYGYTKAEKTREAWVGSGRVRSGRPDPHLPVFLYPSATIPVFNFPIVLLFCKPNAWNRLIVCLVVYTQCRSSSLACCAPAQCYQLCFAIKCQGELQSASKLVNTSCLKRVLLICRITLRFLAHSKSMFPFNVAFVQLTVHGIMIKHCFFGGGGGRVRRG